MSMVIQEPLCLFEALSTPQVPPQQELVENCPNLTTIAGFQVQGWMYLPFVLQFRIYL